MSLATCIRKAGKALSQADAAAVREIHQDYLNDGMTSTDAANKAIDDYLDIINTDRNNIITQIRKQGGDTRAIDSELRVTKRATQQNLEAQETDRQSVIRQAQEASDRSARQAVVNDRYADLKTRYNLDKEEVDSIDNDPKSPESRILKFGALKEDMPTVSEVKKSMSKVSEAAKKAILKLVPRRALPDYLPDEITAGKKHLQLNNRMEGRKSELENAVEPIVNRWHKFHSKNKEMGKKLADMMHAATLAGTDPAENYKSTLDVAKAKVRLARLRQKQSEGKGTESTQTAINKVEEQLVAAEVRKKSHMFLRERFKGLDEEAQSIYREVRDYNQATHELTLQTLQDRIDRSEADEGSKAKMKDVLRQQFEAGRVEGPYFALGRSGNFWAAAKDSSGEVQSYSKFDSRVEMEVWANDWMSEKGITVTTGQLTADENPVEGVNPEFVTKVEDILGRNDVNQQLRDDIWQLYLHTLPEMSARKSFIHRKGRLGFSGDALRSFTTNQFKNAHMIAKLEFVPEIEQSLRDMEKQAEEMNLKDSWAVPVSEEFKRRHRYAMNPADEVITANIMAFGFHWFLGLNPSTAVVNATQTWILGTSVLGAADGGGATGFGRALNALGKASVDILDPRNLRDGPNIHLSPDEQLAFDEFKRINLFEKTQSHDLVGITQKGEQYFSKWKTFSEISAFMFHNVEKYNREATALAAYRMSRDRGDSHETAILTAENLTWDAHFDYSNVNRPPIMQQGLGRVVFMFKNYSVNIGYRLGRDFVDTYKGKDRKQAASRLVGTLMMTALASGVRGLPLIWGAMGLAAMLSDDDEPFDLEGAMRSELTERTNKEISHAIMDGPVDALTGMTLSTRTSLSNLFYRDVNKELGPTEVIPYFLQEFSGAFLGGFIPDLTMAYKDLQEGRGDLALTRVTPTTLKNWLKADRYATEGMKKRDGTTVFDVSEFTETELIGQRLGFAPTKVGLEYKRGAIAYNAEKKLMDRKSSLREQLRNAEERGTKADEAAVWKEIEIFNSKQKDFRDRLTMRSINNARKAGWKKVLQSDRGMSRRSRQRVEEETNF